MLIVGLAGALYADSKVEGPKLGYVSTSGGIRTVLGIVGASRLGAPIPHTNAVVLPGRDVAFRTDADGGVHRIDLLDGSSAAVDVANVTRIVASPTGETVAALTDVRIVVVANGGHLADLELPGSSRLVAVADTGSTAAVTVADGEGEALYISNRESTRRVFTAFKIVAIAFIPKTSDVVFADGAGALYRMNADLQLAQLGEVTGLSALAVTSDRLIGISGRLFDRFHSRVEKWHPSSVPVRLRWHSPWVSRDSCSRQEMTDRCGCWMHRAPSFGGVHSGGCK